MNIKKNSLGYSFAHGYSFENNKKTKVPLLDRLIRGLVLLSTKSFDISLSRQSQVVKSCQIPNLLFLLSAEVTIIANPVNI